jgi:ferritin-like metal-binding protein YciE
MAQTSKNKSRSSASKNGSSNGRQQNKSGAARSNSSQQSKSKEKAGGSLLEKFFTDQLKDIYYAEQQLLKAIPKMKQATTTEDLEDAFDDHLKQTERHVKRLEKVFQIIGKKPEGKKCEAMDGIIKEAEEIIKETKQGTMTRDAALIMAAQKVEHYEIATYGGLVQLAITMGLHRASDILDKTLIEEEDTDALLTEIAETSINIQAEEEGGYSWENEENENEEGEDEEETENSRMASTLSM